MSMYRELLSEAWRERCQVSSCRGVEEIAFEFKRLRAQAQERSSLGEDASYEIVRELSYDLLLLECCRALGMGADLAGFDRPLVERARLEGLLQGAGVDLGRPVTIGPGENPSVRR